MHVWAASVLSGFRFAVKVPLEITHTRKLVDTIEPLDRFVAETAALGDKRGPLLLQLPPGLRFNETVAPAFFRSLRARFDGQVVCEPRHASWFTTKVEALLVEARIVRVAADPPPVPRSACPGGWTDLVYRRLHGSPRIYYSAYAPAYLDMIVEDICQSAARGQEQWCIFDNTALGEATGNAMMIMQRLN